MTTNRFFTFSIDEVTIENSGEMLPESIRLQVEMFLPLADHSIVSAYVDTWKT
jgi:hypothetical protein